MKTKNIWFVLIMVLVLASACDDKFQEINTNPNAITEVDDAYLFTNAVLGTIRGNNNQRIQFPFGSQFGHVYVGRNNTMFIDRYYDYFESAEYKDLYNSFFFGPIKLIEEVVRVTQPGGESENEVRHAMAQVVAMVNYGRLADVFGSIPYTEGGIGQTGILFPKFDSVEFIYTDMMEELKSIIEVLKNASPSMGYPGADPFFDNDLDKWVRFANSFRLRLAMRARFVAPNLANPIIVECLSQPLIESNEQNVWDENEDSDVGEFQNPIYGQYGYWLWRMSDKFVSTLVDTEDPRLPVFVKPNNDGEYIGIPNGLSDGELTKWNWDNISEPTDTLVGKAAPIYQMTAAEIWFLRAEAALFGIVEGDANQLYRKGIELSFEQWTVSQEETDAYLANAEYSNLLGTQEEMFEQISTHLWISFMTNETEGWANIRRTGYPRIAQRTEPVFDLGVTNGVLPTRLKYPTSEVNINNVNYLEAIEEQGPDEIITPLWWDVRD